MDVSKDEVGAESDVVELRERAAKMVGSGTDLEGAYLGPSQLAQHVASLRCCRRLVERTTQVADGGVRRPCASERVAAWRSVATTN